MDEYVLMEQIKNPSVQRLFAHRSAALQNPNVWRYVGQDKQVVVEVKKKDAEPAASEFVNPIEPSGVLDGLRAEYEAKHGKKADARWKIKTLMEKINSETNEV